MEYLDGETLDRVRKKKPKPQQKKTSAPLVVE